MNHSHSGERFAVLVFDSLREFYVSKRTQSRVRKSTVVLRGISMQNRPSRLEYLTFLVRDSVKTRLGIRLRPPTIRNYVRSDTRQVDDLVLSGRRSVTESRFDRVISKSVCTFPQSIVQWKFAVISKVILYLHVLYYLSR